ncbi:MAG: hypothetical protein LBH96_01040 [Candidatus Peribacteria bacterium]|nr:hypothetical protein [Candidatus Peribacteria bacterium]
MESKKQILLIHGGDTHKNYTEFFSSLCNKSVKLEWILSRKDWKNELQRQL